MKALASEANAAKTKLKTSQELAERILAQYEKTRKYETDTERVLPFAEAELSTEAGESIASSSPLADEIQSELVEESLAADQLPEPTQPRALDAEGQPVTEWGYMNRFFQKYNKVSFFEILVISCPIPL